MAGKRKYSHEAEIKAIQMKLKGSPNADIVAVTGMPERTVRAKVAKFKNMFKSLENVDDFELCRQRILSASELELLKSIMSQDKLNAGTIQQLAYAFDKVHHANRLARGLSTTNIESKSFTEIHTRDFKE